MLCKALSPQQGSKKILSRALERTGEHLRLTDLAASLVVGFSFTALKPRLQKYQEMMDMSSALWLQS
jgi:hypothetical protein